MSSATTHGPNIEREQAYYDVLSKVSLYLGQLLYKSHDKQVDYLIEKLPSLSRDELSRNLSTIKNELVSENSGGDVVKKIRELYFDLVKVVDDHNPKVSDFIVAVANLIRYGAVIYKDKIPSLDMLKSIIKTVRHQNVTNSDDEKSLRETLDDLKRKE